MGSISNKPKNKPYSKILPFLTLNQFACQPKNQDRRRTKKRDMDELRKDYIRILYRRNVGVWLMGPIKKQCRLENHVRTHFLFLRTLPVNSLMHNIEISECCRWAQSKIFQFPTYFQKYWYYQKRYRGIYEDICGRKRFVKTTATNVDIELQVDQRSTYHTTFQLLLESWTTVNKKSSICTIHTA